MIAKLKYAVEVLLLYLIDRPTSKMKREREEFAASMPPHPRPGKTIL